MARIALIVGSVRENRQGIKVARFQGTIRQLRALLMNLNGTLKH
jgi:hypothetical protein